MARVSEFKATAKRRAIPQINYELGAHETYLQLARATGAFAAQIGQLADRAAQQEGRQAGLLHGLNATLPQVPVPVALPDGQTGDVVGRIIAIESGGKATAKNPNSSATGAGQFIASTWLSMIRQHRPDLLTNRTTDQVLALRNDANLSREMTAQYARGNVAFLKNNGLSVTPGTTYLAHFLGPSGARSVLTRSRDTSLSSVLSPEVIRANGFLRASRSAIS